MKHLYPPYSPQAQNIIAIFENRAVIQTNKKAYNEYVLYRMGLTAIDEPNESLLILGFQPSKEQKHRTSRFSRPRSARRLVGDARPKNEKAEPDSALSSPGACPSV